MKELTSNIELNDKKNYNSNNLILLSTLHILTMNWPSNQQHRHLLR